MVFAGLGWAHWRKFPSNPLVFGYQYTLQPAAGHYLINPVMALSEAKDSLKELSEFVIATGGNFTLHTIPSWMSFFNAHPGLDVCPMIRNSFLRLQWVL